MKSKLLLTLLAVGLPVLAAAAPSGNTVPYQSTIAESGSAISPDWTVINANVDSKKWTATSNANGNVFSCCVYLGYTSPKNDDWIVSPGISLTAEKEYVVVFWVKSSTSYGECLKLFAGDAPAVDALNAGQEIFCDENIKTSTWTKKTVYFTPTETKDYYFGFYDYSPNKLTLYLGGFQVVPNEFAPNTVGNLKAVAGANRAMTVDLSWTLPTESALGQAFTDEQTIENITIYRDGTELVTLAGDATEWQDTEATGLVGGYHTYEVEVTVAGVKSGKASVTTSYVGPAVPAALPFSIGFTSQDDFTALFTVWTGSASTTTNNWTYNKPYSGDGRAMHSYSSGKTEDDWMATQPVIVENAGKYKITVNAAINYKYTQKLEVYIGSELDNLTKIGSLDAANNEITTTATDYEFYSSIAEPGNYYIAVRACAEKSDGTYYVYRFGMEEAVTIPQTVSNLAYTSEGQNVTLTWTNPTKDLAGDDLTEDFEYNTEIYRNGTLIATLSDKPESYTDENLISGVYTYTVKTVTPDGKSANTAPQIKTTWIGDTTVDGSTLPFICSSTIKKFDLFTVYDANNDGYAWEIKSDNFTFNPDITSDSYGCYTSNNLDYIISPAFQLEPGYYKVTYAFKGKGYPYFAGVTMSEKPASTSDFLVKNVNSKGNTDNLYNVSELVFEATEAGKYYFDICIDEAGSPDNIYASSYPMVNRIELDRITVLPGVATDLTVTPDPDLLLKATISWTNPSTTTVPGIAPEITEAKIYRNNEEIASITEGLTAGESASYVDTTIPNAGFYTYKVEIYNANGMSTTAAPEVESPWIGGGISLEDAPVYFGRNDDNTSADNTFKEWDYSPSKGSTRAWDTGYSGDYAYCVAYKTTAPNAYMISPRLEFVDGHSYDIEIASKTENGYVYNYDLKYTPTGNTTDMILLGNITGDGTSASNPDITVIHIKASSGDSPENVRYLEGEENEEGETEVERVTVPSGIGKLALHAHTASTANYIYRMKITPVDNETDGIENVTVESAEAEFFNLQGLRVENPAHGGIYIKRQGSKVTKVIL